MPIISRSETSVDYLSIAPAPAVVLVHSSVSGNRQWKRLVELLRPTYQCLASDWDAGCRLHRLLQWRRQWAATPPDRRRNIASQLPPNRHEWDAGIEPRMAQSFSGVTARTLILRGSRIRPVTRETAS